MVGWKDYPRCQHYALRQAMLTTAGGSTLVAEHRQELELQLMPTGFSNLKFVVWQARFSSSFNLGERENILDEFYK